MIAFNAEKYEFNKHSSYSQLCFIFQCFKSRVREQNGEESVTRGCIMNSEQIPLLCYTPSHSHSNSHKKRHTQAAGQFAINCCTGDNCNNGTFPELEPLRSPG